MAEEDIVPVDRDWAVRLLEHIDEQWREPLTFDERQEWGKALLALDVDYAVAAFTAAKIASPAERPTLAIYKAIYDGVIEEAHRPYVHPVPVDDQLPVVGDKAVALSEIEQIRARTGLKRDPVRTERLIGSRGR